MFFRKELQGPFFESVQRKDEKKPDPEKKKKTIAEEKGMTVDKPVNKNMPDIIDQIFSASDVLKPYIKANSNLIAEKGKFRIEIGYQNLIAAYKDCHDGNEPEGKIGGFYCRNTGVVHTVAGNNKKEPTSEFGHVIHESIHKKSASGMRAFFTDFINEGVTQYFADKVLEEQNLGAHKKHIYKDQLECARQLIRVVGEDTVAQYYFKGSGSLIDTLNEKFKAERKRDGHQTISPYIRAKPNAELFCTMLKNKQ
jgi:hypothetical protein